jgi:hypothetical protein
LAQAGASINPDWAFSLCGAINKHNFFVWKEALVLNYNPLFMIALWLVQVQV